MKNETPSGEPAGKSTTFNTGTNVKNAAQRQANNANNYATASGPKQIAPSVQPARPDNSFAAYSDKPQPKSPQAKSEY
jgi:hypothetical protein